MRLRFEEERTVGERIASIREEMKTLGLNVEQLAEISGCTAPQVGNAFSKGVATDETLTAIENALFFVRHTSGGGTGKKSLGKESGPLTWRRRLDKIGISVSEIARRIGMQGRHSTFYGAMKGQEMRDRKAVEAFEAALVDAEVDATQGRGA